MTSSEVRNMVSLVLLVLIGVAAAALELADFGPVQAFHGMRDSDFGWRCKSQIRSISFTQQTD